MAAETSASTLNPLESTVLQMVVDADRPLASSDVVTQMLERRVIAEPTILRAVDGLVARGLLVSRDGHLVATSTPQDVVRQERAVVAPAGGFRLGSSAVCEPWPPRPTKCC